MAEIHYSDDEPILAQEERNDSLPPDDADGPSSKKFPSEPLASALAENSNMNESIDDDRTASNSASPPPSSGIPQTKPKVIQNRSNLSDFYREHDRDRSQSIPIQATILCPPPPQATAIFYSDDSGVGDDGAGNASVNNGHAHAVEEKHPLGSTNELNCFAVSVGDSLQSESDLDSIERAIQWDLNYQEAAIYLEEGANNDKFDTHPRDQASLPAYSIVHNRAFYSLEFLVALLLMSLAFIEKPSVTAKAVEEYIHVVLEIVFLGIISMESFLKIRWMGPKVFAKHKRSMFKVVLLFVMIVEALVVLARRDSHFRVTRALRPIFLMDCRYARGVRRFVRQIFLSFPPVIEMCCLLVFFNFIFAILGNSLFPEDDHYFPDLGKSFVSLFVLFTSANYPDVMMQNYDNEPWSFLFFLVYIIIELYFIMNLLLAVVVNTFSENELKKLKGLLLHRREACRRAFKLLNSKSHPRHVSVKHFAGLTRYFYPRKSIQHVYLCFKILNKSETGLISLDEFMNVYEASELKWKEFREASGPWFNHVTNEPLRRCGEAVNKFVRWRGFKYLVFVVLFANAVVKAAMSSSKFYEYSKYIEIGFLGFYVLEAALKIFGLGPKKYFSSLWNVFDFIITIMASIDHIWLSPINGIKIAESVSNIINVLRPLRLLRLFKYRKRFRDVFATVFLLLPRMSSVGTVLLLLYYFYAIIGMEIFSVKANQSILTDCCNGTTFEESYKNKTGYYYLNNFDNILRSMVTLFELTVVNNWFIIMDGFAAIIGESSRIFFMTFYLITMVVMNIVIAFILEAFTFRIDYRKTTDKDMDEDALVNVTLQLNKEENRMIGAAETALKSWQIAVKHDKSVHRPPPPLADALHGNFIRKKESFISGSNSLDSASASSHIDTNDSMVNETKYRGTRSRRKVDFSITMFSDQVESWYKVSDEECSKHDEGTPLLTLSERRKTHHRVPREEDTRANEEATLDSL